MEKIRKHLILNIPYFLLALLYKGIAGMEVFIRFDLGQKILNLREGFSIAFNSPPKLLPTGFISWDSICYYNPSCCLYQGEKC